MESPEIHGVVAREFSRLMRPENYTDYSLLQVFVDTNTWLYLPEGPINSRALTEDCSEPYAQRWPEWNDWIC
jgi:hypothetical protein